MGHPNYRQIEQMLTSHTPFIHGHSMSAERTAEAYIIYSYDTEIARYSFADGEWTLNPRRYSVTTSKQQNIVRRVARAQGYIAAPETLEFP